MSVYKVNTSTDFVVATGLVDPVVVPFDNLKISSAGEFNTSTFTFVPLETANPVTFLVIAGIEFQGIVGEDWTTGETATLKLNWNTGYVEKVHTVTSNNNNPMGISIHTLVTVPYNSWMKLEVIHTSASDHTLLGDSHLTEINIAAQTS